MGVNFCLIMGGAGSAESVSKAGVPDTDAASKWGDNYVSEGAIAFENSLLCSAFSVSVLDRAGTHRMGHLEALSCIAVDRGNNKIAYDFLGDLVFEDGFGPEDFKKDICKLEVVANVTPTGGASDELTYSFIGTPSDDFRAIPMWGVTEIDLSGLVPGKRINVGDISLLRAMAKVEVALSAELARSIDILSVSVSPCNRIGYVLPGGWDRVSDTAEINFDECVRIPSSPLALEPFKSSSRGKSAAFYMPECVNSADNEILLTVRYYDNDAATEGEGRLHICRYNDERPAANAALWNIIRNHIYRYTVTGLPGGSEELKFNASIIDMVDGGTINFEY